MAEGDGLENRLARKGHGGSNPSSSVSLFRLITVPPISSIRDRATALQVEIVGTEIVQASPVIDEPAPSKEIMPAKHGDAGAEAVT